MITSFRRREGLIRYVRLGVLAKVPAQRAGLALLLAAVLIAAVVATRLASGSCSGGKAACAAHNYVRWSRSLGGPWIAQDGVEGTIFSQGQASAAAGHGVAVIGFGLRVRAYDVKTGFPRWTQDLTGLPAGSAIVSVRAWRGVVTVGVSVPSGAAPTDITGSSAVGTAEGSSGRGAATRREIVLNSVTGAQLRTYEAAASGGAVLAGMKHTVIVGTTAVTSYLNSNGRATWRDATGAEGQAWRVADGKLYVTVSAGGQVGTDPVTAVREIRLSSGGERLIRPRGESFHGALTAVVGGALVFSGSTGLSMYSVANGRLTAEVPRAVVQGSDPVQGVLYADVAGALTGLDPVTGRKLPAQPGTVPIGVYGVRAGVAFGLDTGADGAAWGYNVAKRHTIWTAKSLPWPHYFAETSGLDGNVDPASGIVLLVTCQATGRPVRGAVVGGSGKTCLKPRLVAVGPWGSKA
ncbi:MAG: hypothetical protein LBV34_07775 [Nocardiopsaceae bacterium]|jgi:hypothetical protein|nr:hypothetical protein [Nocardiopsaceae bacterium]